MPVRPLRGAAVLLGALLAALAAGLPAGPPAVAVPVAPHPVVQGNPFLARPPAVEADTQAAQAARAAGERGDVATATALQVLAREPQAAWYLGDQPASTVTADVSRRASSAARLSRTAVLVLYALPHRDCSGASSGGSSATAYRALVRAVGRGLASARAAVVLEPDGLALLDCLTSAQRQERSALLRDAVQVLSAAGASVYLDAGHAGWVPVAQMAGRLRASGVQQARGVALDVSSFGATAGEVAYARALAARVPGLHAVVDTSRNGNGPAPDQAWCNPPGRALGARPQAAHDPVVDALLWVKRPGESDGDCGRGEPSAGSFWSGYALGLVAGSAR